MDFREGLKRGLPYGIILLLDFYLIPCLIRDTGSGMFFLLIVMPLVCFTAAAAYGRGNGFHLLFGIMTAALFAPSIFLFYNASAWVYIVVFGVIAVLGNAAGLLFRESKGK